MTILFDGNPDELATFFNLLNNGDLNELSDELNIKISGDTKEIELEKDVVDAIKNIAAKL
ncbi:MAG: hypothetical protein IJT73_00685 [Selenomonadaceae bacterium]|nr:hypothetical protein [Selenomonadaceae bacterium]